MSQFIEFIGNHAMLSGLFLALLTWLIIGEFRRASHGGQALSPLQATQYLNHNNAIMLDIRDSNESDTEGSIVNSVQIPLAEIETQIKKIEKYKNRPIIAYCRSGNRSMGACNALKKHGFTQVYNLQGGITAWQRDNLPLIKK